MNHNYSEMTLKLKKHMENYASQQLAVKLHGLLPLDQGFDFRPLIGNTNNRDNVEAIQTWIKATLQDYPVTGCELSLDNWHSRLVSDLICKLCPQREE